uniref:Uncharacterized protein n=1 Tax=Accipiter nisus TaxID=211598 RepID=A0A8B9RW28_9AVES
MHFLCFRPERLQTCQGCHKANNLTLSHSKLPCDQELPLWPSMTTFLPEQQNKSHPKSTKQRFLLQERDRLGKFDLPFISIVTIQSSLLHFKHIHITSHSNILV